MISFINKSLLFIKNSVASLFSIEDILFIKNTGLFNDTPEEYLHHLPKEELHFNQGQLIVKAGQYNNNLFIIKQGAVSIFQHDESGGKICTATLSQGDFFGEPEVIGKEFKTRSGDVEAIVNVEIIKIARIAHRYTHRQSLAGSHFGASGIGFNKAIEKLISQPKISKKFDVPAGEVFFDYGDKPDYIYIILRGEVLLILPSTINKQYARLVIHEGHLFGEKSVLENRPRQARAVAGCPSTLVKIATEDFHEFYLANQDFQDLCKSLHSLHRIPLKGLVNQYIGTIEEIGSIVTNSYELEDGGHVSSNAIVNSSTFNMSVNHYDTGKHLYYERENNTLDLYVLDERLLRISASGFWEVLPALCNCLLNKEIFRETMLDSDTNPPLENRHDEVHCPDMSMTNSQLKTMMPNGINSLDSLSATTGLAGHSKNGLDHIMEMPGAGYWRHCLLLKGNHLNSYITCYVKPIEGSFNPFHPGQHLTLQGNVDGTWVEKSFYILEQLNENELEIIVCGLDDDLFSRWLYQTLSHSEQIIIESSQPAGNLSFNFSPTASAFCVIEKTGLVPIYSFIRQLAKTANHKRVHVMFNGSNEEYLILKSRLNDYSETLPALTFNFLPDSTSSIAIKKFIDLFENADIYVCGTQNFVSVISSTLRPYLETNKLIYETTL